MSNYSCKHIEQKQKRCYGLGKVRSETDRSKNSSRTSPTLHEICACGVQAKCTTEAVCGWWKVRAQIPHRSNDVVFVVHSKLTMHEENHNYFGLATITLEKFVLENYFSQIFMSSTIGCYGAIIHMEYTRRVKKHDSTRVATTHSHSQVCWHAGAYSTKGCQSCRGIHHTDCCSSFCCRQT